MFCAFGHMNPRVLDGGLQAWESTSNAEEFSHSPNLPLLQECAYGVLFSDLTLSRITPRHGQMAPDSSKSDLSSELVLDAHAYGRYHPLSSFH